MKTIWSPLGALLAALLAACVTNAPEENLAGAGNMWVGSAIRSASLNKAILVQHTLYPYHFEVDSPSLNELGERDLDLLAQHFVKEKGELSLRRGGAPNALYDARLKQVQERLAKAGVPKDRLTIQDALPGGQGITSERVLVILAKPPFNASSAGTASGAAGAAGASAGGAAANTRGMP
jgi:hypothetical protein